MHYMNFPVYFVSFLIIVSKYLDCKTTSSQITNVEQEKNPFARALMRKFGINVVIWGVFFLVIIMVAFSVYLLFNYFNTTFYKIFYVILGLIISFFHFAIAHTNQTKKLNFITKYLAKIYKQTL